ncbi:Os01g0680950, partial [Oryza sativa Japonica Group]
GVHACACSVSNNQKTHSQFCSRGELERTSGEIEGEGRLALVLSEAVVDGDGVAEGEEHLLPPERRLEPELEGEVDLGLLHHDGVVVVLGLEEALVGDHLRRRLPAEAELLDVGQPRLADPPNHGARSHHHPVLGEPHPHPPRAVHRRDHHPQHVVLPLRVLRHTENQRSRERGETVSTRILARRSTGAAWVTYPEDEVVPDRAAGQPGVVAGERRGQRVVAAGCLRRRRPRRQQHRRRGEHHHEHRTGARHLPGVPPAGDVKR